MLKLKCQFCSKEFLVKACRAKTAKFCSNECRKKQKDIGSNKPGICPACGREHWRSKTGICSRCYRCRYRNTEAGRRTVAQADKAYAKRLWKKNPDKRRQWVYNWQTKTGQLIPVELWQLRVAQKRLEAALEATKNGAPVRKPSERRCNQSIKRRDGYGLGQSVRIADKGVSTGSFHRSN